MWVEFARSMAPMMQMPAELIAQMFAGSKPIKVLDISAGHGLYGIAFAKHNPNAKVVGLDWANVLEVAKENAAQGRRRRSLFHHSPAARSTWIWALATTSF